MLQVTLVQLHWHQGSFGPVAKATVWAGDFATTLAEFTQLLSDAALVVAHTGNRHHIPQMWNRFKGDPIQTYIKFRQLCLYSKGILQDFQEVLLKGLHWE